MTNALTQLNTDHMQALFGVGTCVGLTDGQLLERFMAGGEEAGNLAFETLVTRHCRRLVRRSQVVRCRARGCGKVSRLLADLHQERADGKPFSA